MSVLSDSDEFELFNTEAVAQLIRFKWEVYGQRHHTIGAVVHLIQTLILTFYVNIIYINNMLCTPEEVPIEFQTPGYAPTASTVEKPLLIECAANPYAILLLGGVIYPLVYELTQCRLVGIVDYFLAIENYLDIMYISSSIAMTISHLLLNPFHILSKIIIIFVICMASIRTFKVLKIFPQFSTIVTMLEKVIFDL